MYTKKKKQKKKKTMKREKEYNQRTINGTLQYAKTVRVEIVLRTERIENRESYTNINSRPESYNVTDTYKYRMRNVRKISLFTTFRILKYNFLRVRNHWSTASSRGKNHITRFVLFSWRRIYGRVGGQRAQSGAGDIVGEMIKIQINK